MQLVGRFQSRAYQKQLADGTTLNKVAYEVSVSRLAALKTEERSELHDLTAQIQPNQLYSAMRE